MLVGLLVVAAVLGAVAFVTHRGGGNATLRVSASESPFASRLYEQAQFATCLTHLKVVFSSGPPEIPTNNPPPPPPGITGVVGIISPFLPSTPFTRSSLGPKAKGPPPGYKGPSIDDAHLTFFRTIALARRGEPLLAAQDLFFEGTPDSEKALLEAMRPVPPSIAAGRSLVFLAGNVVVDWLFYPRAHPAKSDRVLKQCFAESRAS